MLKLALSFAPNPHPPGSPEHQAQVDRNRAYATKFYSGQRDLLHGGKADKIPPSAFPTKKVEQGAKVESEHTSNKTLAKEIARDHLAEDMGYYEKLKQVEKKAQVDAFFDELLGISASIEKQAAFSGKGSLIGGGAGLGLGAVRAAGQEIKERAADDRAKLTDDEKKKLRKKRLAGHAVGALGTASLGAGLGGAHKHIGEHAKKVVKQVREAVQPEANAFAGGFGGALAEGVQTRLNVEDAGRRFRNGVLGFFRRKK